MFVVEMCGFVVGNDFAAAMVADAMVQTVAFVGVVVVWEDLIALDVELYELTVAVVVDAAPDEERVVDVPGVDGDDVEPDDDVAASVVAVAGVGIQSSVVADGAAYGACEGNGGVLWWC